MTEGMRELDDNIVSLAIARVTDRRNKTDVAVLHSIKDAKEWCEWRLGARIVWGETRGASDHEAILGYAAGADVAEIREVPVTDPCCSIEG